MSEQVVGPRFFFVHIMKTGGATLRQHLYANFEHGEVYPVPGVEDMNRAWLVETVLSLPQERRAQIRVYTGHFPFLVSQLIGVPAVTMTILRDPVERAVSYLKHAKRYHPQHHDHRFEEIYEDPFYFHCFIHNHQAKVFSMTTDDKLESYLDVIDVDDARLETAKRNLQSVDVFGLNDRYSEFLGELRGRFGWRFDVARNRRVSRESWNVSSALRRRIADDNRADLEFYEFATRLYRERHDSRVGV